MSADLGKLVGDGVSLYQYCRSDPIGRRDPTGLFGPTDILSNAIMFGVRGVRGGLESMLDQYAANMEDDFDWAMDWSQPDDAYSRLNSDWVAASFEDGMMGGFEDAALAMLDDMTFGLWPDGGQNGQPAMAGIVTSTGRVLERLTGQALKEIQRAAITTAMRPYGKGGMTKAARELTKHPELLGIAKSGGEANKALLKMCGGQNGLNVAAAKRVNFYLQYGTPVRVDKHIEFWINGKAARLRDNGRFIGFLTDPAKAIHIFRQ
jgi:hypothetical protein